MYKEVAISKCSRKFQREKLKGCVSGDNVTILTVHDDDDVEDILSHFVSARQFIVWDRRSIS